MKLLFFSHYFTPESNAPALRTHEHCCHWVKLGAEVTVITCAPNCPDGKVYKNYKNKLFQKETIDGIKVIRIWTFLAANKGFIKRVINFISYMFMALFVAIFYCRKVDIIIATSPQFFCGWAGVLFKWIKRKPLILEIRDIWPESILAVGALKRNFIFKFLEKLEVIMYKSANKIITVGNGYKKEIKNKGIKSEKIAVILNGIDKNFLNLEKNNLFFNDFIKNSQDKFICSYIGTVGMAHGLQILLDTAIIARDNGQDDIIFAIVGAGAELQNLKDKAKKMKLKNIIFTDRINRKHIPSAIESSNAVLVHLKSNNLFKTVIPSKIFEIMALEKPILMGVSGEALDIVEDANAGIHIKPESAKSLLAGINELRKNPSKYIADKKVVSQKFSRESSAEKMYNIMGDFL